MNDAKFTELVNLYFDREISQSEIELLREALAASPERKGEFEARYRLHQAMQKAVEPQVREVAQFREIAAQKTVRASRMTVWVLGSGVAACVALGVVLFRPAIHESVNVATVDELNDLAHSDIERFAAARGQTQTRRGSLASQLRLMGLTPDMAPAERQLSGLDVEATRQREALRQREIERINQYKSYSAIPEPRLFESLDRDTNTEPSQHRWPAGFQSSLASF